MAILRGSRYEGVAFTGIRTVDGKTKKFLHDRRIFTLKDVGANTFEHMVKGQETLDGLAETFYENQNLWWLIADVNNILFALDLQPGTILKIPNRAVLADLGLL
jgi:nucleoid-associated protein YgaU